MLRIATWNINSIRARADRLTHLLLEQDIDIIAVQETKAKPEQVPDFPLLREKDYQWASVGYNQWNGVAIFSRVGLDNIRDHFPNQPGFHKDPEKEQAVEARAIGATCGGIDVWSLYIPNGRALADRHYTYKLEWLDTLASFAGTYAPDDKALFMGDFNVAPQEGDVWDNYPGETHISEPERAAFQKLIDSGLVDITRPLFDDYTYWDYMKGRFYRDHGMRIDFQLGTPAMHADKGWVVREERATKGSSDHAPVIVDYQVGE